MANFNFKQAAVDHGVYTCEVAMLPKATSEVIDDMMGSPVTITKVGVTKSNKGPYAVFTCAEYPDFHFHAGQRFNELVEAWNMELEPGYDTLVPGNCEALNKEIQDAGGLTARFTKQPNKSDSSKSDYWNVELL